MATEGRTAQLHELSTVELARLIRTRSVSAVEAVCAALDRIDAVNGAVVAVAEIDAEQALERAEEADRRVASGAALGALHGVPVTFKANVNMEGRANTNGVRAYLANVATESDPQVTSWLNAGAIPVGRTNCPAFSTRWTTENDLYGTTVNPWDPAVTPGGSSGGAAVAVATGMCSVAHGNDIAGSIRYPAACCGVTGIRPTIGRVPGWYGPTDHDPPLAVQTYLVQGPLARTIADLRVGLAAMEAPDPRDPGAIQAALRSEATRPIKVAMVAEPGGGGLAGSSNFEAIEATHLAAQWLEEAGYHVEEVDVPQLGEAAALWWKLALTELKLGLLAEVRRVADESTVRFFQLMFEVYDQEFGEVDLAGFAIGYGRRGGLRREMSLLMQSYPLILTPSSGEPPFPMGDDVISVDRTAELMSHGWPGMSIATLGLPAVGLGATREAGAPVGVQLVGRPFDEPAVFEAAEVIEARSGIRTPIDPQGGLS